MQNLNPGSSNTLENIKLYTHDVFSHWLDNWSLCENNFSIDVGYKQLSNIKNYKSFVCENLFLLENDSQFNWQAVLFGDVLLELPAKINLSELVASSKDDLINPISKGRKWTSVEKYTPPKHYSIYVAIDIQLKNEKLSFLIPLHCAFKIFDVSKKPVKKSQLVKKIDILPAKKCALNVKLNFGDFSVAELSELVVGSVLCPDLTLDNKFLLETNNLRLADVAIGQISDRKVFMISGDKK